MPVSGKNDLIQCVFDAVELFRDQRIKAAVDFDIAVGEDETTVDVFRLRRDFQFAAGEGADLLREIGGKAGKVFLAEVPSESCA